MGTDLIKIKCHKGAKEGDMLNIEVSRDTPLCDIRILLEDKKFITPDSNNTAYRFIFKKTKAQKNILDDVLAPINSEEYVPVHSVLGDNNQLILTDWLKKKSPDLVGFGCTWWYDRYLSVRCRLNRRKSAAEEKNKAVKAFEPLMLTDVIPTSKNVVGFYNNVLVCLEGSVVDFQVKSWGAAGFTYRITTQAGEPIIKNVCKTFKGDYGKYVTAGADYWQSSKKLIEIHAIEKLNISKDKVIAYQKLTFKSCNIISYKTSDGKVYHSDARPPVMAAPSTDTDTKPMLRSVRAAADAKEEIVVPGDSITPGTVTEGDQANINLGTIYDVKYGIGQPIGEEEAWNDPLGNINVFLFVFKSYEEAITVIQALNTPDPEIWD